MTTLALPAATIGGFGQLDPLHQAVIGYLARYQNSPNTFREYKRDLQLFLDWCTQVGIAPLAAKRGQLEMYVAHLHQQGWAESTMHRRVLVTKRFFHFAYVDELIDRDPAAGVDLPKVDKDKQKRAFLSAVDLSTLMKTAERHGSTQDQAILTTLAMTAMRVGELTSLNADSLFYENGYPCIRYIRKGRKLTIKRLEPPVMMALAAHLAGRTTGPIFLNQWGNRMDRGQVADVLRRLCLLADVPVISPHGIRRSCATSLIDHGVAITAVQAMLCHEQVSTTSLYDRHGQQRGNVASATMADLLTTLKAS